MGNGRRGDWLQTYTGGRVYPLDPREDEINIVDVARGLAAAPRFAGHTKWVYYVAQHAVMVADHCSVPNKMLGLHHDDPEFCLGDLVSPFKHDSSMAPYRVAEDHMLAVILRALGVPFVPFLDGVELPDEVHMVDKRVLATEVRDLSPDPSAWSNLPEPYPEYVRRLTHEEAAAEFLERWEQYRKDSR